jgi:hypothetical protein
MHITINCPIWKKSQEKYMAGLLNKCLLHITVSIP